MSMLQSLISQAPYRDHRGRRPSFAERDNLRSSHVMRAAMESTELLGFGDPSFRQELDALVWSLRHECDLNPRGRRTATDMLAAKLAVRLQVVNAHQRFPEIAEQRIEAPIFIIGMPRTGSTLMHHLLGQDPQLRVPRRWELHHPWPPPNPSTYFDDPRIARHDAEMASMVEARRRLAAMHPTRADFPEECGHLLTPTFASTLYWVLFGAPEYQLRLTACPMEDAYRFHRMFLQLLQWRYPATPWVLRYPGHVGHLEDLCRVYPDARFVWLHRDPVDAITSATNLVWIANEANRRRCDPASIAFRITEDYATRIRTSMEQRSVLETMGSPWLDVRYDDFIADPVAQVKDVYRWARLELDGETEAKMQRYVDHPPYPRGGYTNDPVRLGIERGLIRYEFADYVRRHLGPRVSA